MQSYVVSVLPFVPPSALKAQMNQHFSRKYPQLSHTLSYTKIKRIHSLLGEVGSRDQGCLGLEACTVALAYVLDCGAGMSGNFASFLV